MAGVEDITHGLPRVQELFEARNPKGEAIIADIDGRVELLTSEDGARELKVIFSEMREDAHAVPRIPPAIERTARCVSATRGAVAVFPVPIAHTGS